MESTETLVSRITALEKENNELKKAVRSERRAKATAFLESKTIFKTIFESSRLGNKTFTLPDIISAISSHLLSDDKDRLEFRGDQNIELFGDEHKIEQVLVNLINNAVKYAPLSKRIIIQVEQLEGFVKISVIDLGPGIPEESLSMLFDRYYRLEQNRFTAGLGLGLYISLRLSKGMVAR